MCEKSRDENRSAGTPSPACSDPDRRRFHLHASPVPDCSRDPWFTVTAACFDRESWHRPARRRPCFALCRGGFLFLSRLTSMPKERVMGFEPTTTTLATLCSTPELHPLQWVRGHEIPREGAPGQGLDAERSSRNASGRPRSTRRATLSAPTARWPERRIGPILPSSLSGSDGNVDRAPGSGNSAPRIGKGTP